MRSTAVVSTLYEGNYSTYPGEEAARSPGDPGKKDQKLAKRPPRAGLGPLQHQGSQAKSKARLAWYEEMAAEADIRPGWDLEDSRSHRPRLGTQVIEAKNLKKGFTIAF